MSTSLILCAIAALVQGAWAAEPAASSAATSAKAFVQSFYDWYAIKTDKQPDIRGTEAALKQKKGSFDIPLYKELMVDQDATAKSKDGIVGLDFDPFVNANGLIYDKYQAGDPVAKGATYRVPVYGIQGKDKPKFVVEPEVAVKSGHCVFTNFHFGKTSIPANENLLSVLSTLKKQRRDYGP